MDNLQYFTKTISTKLMLLEDILDLDPAKMAEITDCSVASYYRYRAGKSIPGWDFLLKIINYDNKINANWLLKNKGPIIDSDHEFVAHDQNTITLPFFKMNEDNNSGEGFLNTDDWFASKQEIRICLDIFKFLTFESFGNLAVIEVQCDAMYPEIKPGSTTIVDKQQNNINYDGIFLIRTGRFIRLKMIQILPGNKVQLSTVNDKYKSFSMSYDDLEENIIGRIIWVGTPYN